jgi:hypothetical protein
MADTTELAVRSESVQRLYGMYLSDTFRVNRRYQRKLVWSVEEKQKLIDSILRDLPIPLFLVADIGSPSDASYELIDGMQRLNAIFSFIENEFPVGGEYFDLDALADTKLKKDRGQLTQRSNIMSRDKSVKLANYTIALSVFRALHSTSVDEVFRRINSGGRRLSPQELRQAGTISTLADLVRIVSSSIRGDTSPRDVVPLRAMQQLSISNRELNYGIVADNIFWIKQGILRREDVRESNDEQVVLDLLIDSLIDPLPNSGTRIRNAYYNFTDTESDATKESLSIANAIDAYEFERAQQDFLRIYDQIREILSNSDRNFAQLIGVNRTGRATRYFHAVFMAVFELMIRDRMRLKDVERAVTVLDGIATGALSIPPGGGDWVRDSKRQSINAVKGVLRDVFEPTDDKHDYGRYSWASQLETTLSNALVEQQLFECKQGFLSLGPNREFDEASFSKICRTLTAMANAGGRSVGYLAVGIADDMEDGRKVKEVDGIEPIMYRQFCIVGIQREARLREQTLNDYWSWLMQRFKSSKLDSRLASYVAAESRLVNYRDYPVALLKVRSQDSPCFYEGALFERVGSETVELAQGDYIRVFQRFT